MITRVAIDLLRLRRAAFRRKAVPRDAVTSVALIELTGLGDVLSMLPAVRGCKTLFPSANVHLVVARGHVELLSALELPVNVYGVIDPGSLSGTMAAIQLLRDLRVTLACSMSPPRRNALVTLAGQARCVAGYLSYRDTLTPYLAETPVEVFGLSSIAGQKYGRQHISERALLICRALGFQDDVAVSRLHVAEPVALEAQTILKHAGLVPPGQYAVLHPFAGWKYREWPLTEFGALAKRLVQTGNTTVVFLWQEEKEGDLQWLRREFAGNRSVLFASTLSLLGTAVLLSGASLFVGNDSGPLHLAAALGVPSVGLFGPCDPILTAPRSTSRTFWLYKQFDCSPCDQRGCVKPDQSCMKAISVEEVFQAAVSLQGSAPDA